MRYIFAALSRQTGGMGRARLCSLADTKVKSPFVGGTLSQSCLPTFSFMTCARELSNTEYTFVSDGLCVQRRKIAKVPPGAKTTRALSIAGQPRHVRVCLIRLEFGMKTIVKKMCPNSPIWNPGNCEIFGGEELGQLKSWRPNRTVEQLASWKRLVSTVPARYPRKIGGWTKVTKSKRCWHACPHIFSKCKWVQWYCEKSNYACPERGTGSNP